MNNRLAAVLAVTALVVASGVVIGAGAFVGHARSYTARHNTVRYKAADAMAQGWLLADVVNLRSRQLRTGVRLRPVHCAADPGSYACSFLVSPRHQCRFVRFVNDGGNMEILVAGLVPLTFCQSGSNVG